MSANSRVNELLDRLRTSCATPEEVCASSPELLPEVRRQWSRLRQARAEIDMLFPLSEGEGSTLPAHSAFAADLPQIPGYEVEAFLGRGGVSVVYLAHHLRLNRKVALKMLLVGAYATPQELERFQREAQAVAGLRHPNIVQLYDAGDIDRRPYFTMELVERGSLAGKLVGAPQPSREAAALLAKVADAVHAAHQLGIVHRDLKPSNILLTDDGTPKVSDFGLARHLESDDLTLTGVAIGTPSYMAPEQARGERSAMGPAADVYAIGAILYEMLTGRPPFRGESNAATIQQVLAIDPVVPKQLNPRVPRDLQTICIKCLEKEPARRYASAAALADDLRRFERGEPIAARPVGWPGRLYRFARRRPAVAALSGALLLAVVSLMVALTVGRAEAIRNLKRSEKANQVLLEVFRGINLERERKGGPPLLAQLSEQLNRAADLLEEESLGAPVEVARMQRELGLAELYMNHTKEAIDLLTRAQRTLETQLGRNDPDTLGCLRNLVMAYLNNGETARAISLGEETAARCRDALGPDHPVTLKSIYCLACACLVNDELERAISLCEETRSKQLALLGPDNPDTLDTSATLADAYDLQGRHAEAVTLLEDVLPRTRALLGPDHHQTLTVMNSLAVVYITKGESERALPVLETVLAKHRGRIGADHPSTLATMVNLARAYADAGQGERAVPLLEEARAKYETLVGPNHVYTLETMQQLADVYASVGRVRESIALWEEVVKASEGDRREDAERRRKELQESKSNN